MIWLGILWMCMLALVLEEVSLAPLVEAEEA